ncbi:hypothetical protein [Absidia glauca]|uniref:Uncharacterized protein n=1 Tax=Absidia glauca TaxID=4829 RepID=A0A168QZ86_ABSGL|nr:hypothetical protein [Absidia glauca]
MQSTKQHKWWNRQDKKLSTDPLLPLPNNRILQEDSSVSWWNELIKRAVFENEGDAVPGSSQANTISTILQGNEDKRDRSNILTNVFVSMMAGMVTKSTVLALFASTRRKHLWANLHR